MNNLNFIGFQTLLRKEITRFLRIWSQTILPSVITVVLYFVIFGNLIGGRLGDMHGFTYVQYIAPGLIMMQVIMNAYANVSASFFGSKFGRSIEELLVSPMPNYLILLGYVAGGVVRGLMVGAAVMAVSLFFIHLHVYSFITVFLIVLLSAILFSLAGLLNGIFARKFDDVSIIPTFVLTPLTYLGGVFYSVSLLPPFWEKLSMINPVLYMVSAFRYGMLGVSDVSLSMAFLIVILFIVILFFTNLHLLKNSLGLRA